MRKIKKKIEFKIAADGSSASGKTTGGKLIAKKLKMKFLSSGTLYRFCALKTLENKFGFEEKSSKADKNFFNLGKKNKWQETLDPVSLKMLTDEFKEEMTELSYL